MQQLFVFGSGFAVLYLASGNLFVAVGTHALINADVTVARDPFQSPHTLDYLYLGAALLAAMTWRITRALRTVT